jgi:uroporphyrinogen decarboxylase
MTPQRYSKIHPILTPRDRFGLIITHQEADRVPLDLGGTSLTSIAPGVLQGLKDLLGIYGPATTPYRPLDERVLDALHIDFRRLGRLIGSGERFVDDNRSRTMDMWGIERAWTGQYWDIVKSPLKGATVGDLLSYAWPEPETWIQNSELEELEQEARRLWEQTETIVVAEHPVYGVFELACWMCGFDDFLWRLAGDAAFVHRLFTILLELQKGFIEPYYRAIGNFIHLTTSGDDFGTQIGPFLSPKAFREFIQPYLRERIIFTHLFTPALFWHHSCGSIHELIPDLIDCGVDILNPIQPGAKMMEPERLKKDFGDRLCFHGGFDTQGVLPFERKDEIVNEVRRVMNAMKPGGGYIFSAAHNIQEDVPAESVLAMYEAAYELGEYL